MAPWLLTPGSTLRAFCYFLGGVWRLGFGVYVVWDVGISRGLNWCCFLFVWLGVFAFYFCFFRLAGCLPALLFAWLPVCPACWLARWLARWLAGCLSVRLLSMDALYHGERPRLLSLRRCVQSEFWLSDDLAPQFLKEGMGASGALCFSFFPLTRSLLLSFSLPLSHSLTRSLAGLVAHM